jgi:DNA-binding SARP family transcriptional activator
VRLDANGYRLDVAPDDVDAHLFEALIEETSRSTGETAVALLDEALRLWRGPLTAELSDCPFAQAEAVRLEEMRIAGRERRAELLLSLGRAADTVGDLRQLVLECRHRERARALLMEALSRTGRQTEALDEYRAWRTDLAETGLEPSPDVPRTARRRRGDRRAAEPADRTGCRRAIHRTGDRRRGAPGARSGLADRRRDLHLRRPPATRRRARRKARRPPSALAPAPPPRRPLPAPRRRITSSGVPAANT